MSKTEHPFHSMTVGLLVKRTSEPIGAVVREVASVLSGRAQHIILDTEAARHLGMRMLTGGANDGSSSAP